ncbi:hypothetical protein EAY36_22040, partial [Vibrio anguillarum]|nr:hypothetical protein [Vibrio anguillarum]
CRISPNDDGRTTTKTEEEEEGESRASTLSLIVYSCANMALLHLLFLLNIFFLKLFEAFINKRF